MACLICPHDINFRLESEIKNEEQLLRDFNDTWGEKTSDGQGNDCNYLKSLLFFRSYLALDLHLISLFLS
ncbi:MAG: hypothetical protein A3I05_05795 [Deltaproteobacteria bacterium RIFCSPLOWO2_02_FULL_44_10]|nr:MAG: hypothetical protein A3C46_04620 [Deltaproteobacteria bacterium RIFCSPHIGHO2_02_FULL_44_16]OGQ46121.1 MAG: hypothetical protein A3I05_05795 [Deltaproteobacteria bacterium RIFCSPLOWO2_02_FULL_44_10]